MDSPGIYLFDIRAVRFVKNRFHDDETVLDRLDGLYPPDELMDYRLAHTNFRDLFPDRVPEEEEDLSFLEESDWEGQ